MKRSGRNGGSPQGGERLARVDLNEADETGYTGDEKIVPSDVLRKELHDGRIES